MISHSTILAVCLVLAVMLSCVDALKFAVIGDWGTGGRKAHSAWEIRSAEYLNEVCGKIKCNFTISCGDNIYVGNVKQGLVDSFEEMFDDSTGPFFPVPGNHDNVGPQLEYAKTHKKWRFDKGFYSYKLPIDNTGYAVEIFGVDTTDGSLGGGAQYRWLENKLAESTARWKFIYGHYPFTGSGRHRRVGTVGRIPGLMRQYNVQAYFYGHDHIVEISNGEGRIYGLSGGMARGGMMLRGLGGGSRRFTLTTPNEYNKYKQDWGEHGFFTGDLSPNVLTLGVWFNYGGLQYEFSVTHDWVVKSLNVSKAERDQWPPSDVVLQAYKDEMELPVGTEAEDAVKWDSDRTIIKPGPTPPPTPKTPPPTTPGPAVNGTTTASPPTTSAPPTTTRAETPQPPTPPPTNPPDLSKMTNPPVHYDHASLGEALYAVSAECEECANGPRVKQPFTITIQDLDVSGSKFRLFLTTSATGCIDSTRRMILDGSDGVHPLPTNTIVLKNSVDFKTQVFVCLSVDGGSSFERIRRVNDPVHNEEPLPTSFILEDGTQTPAPAAPTYTPAPQTPGGGGNSPTTPGGWQGTPAPSSGHSFGTLVLVGVFCLGVGLAFSYMKDRNGGGGPASHHQGAEQVSTIERD